MLKLKLQHFGYLMRTANSLEKTLMLGKIKGRVRRGWQKMRCLDGVTDSVDRSLSKLWEILKDRDDWCAVVHEATKRQTHLATEQQQERVGEVGHYTFLKYEKFQLNLKVAEDLSGTFPSSQDA